MYYVLNIAGLSLFLYRNGVLTHEAGTWLQAVHEILVLELTAVLCPIVKTIPRLDAHERSMLACRAPDTNSRSLDVE